MQFFCYLDIEIAELCYGCYVTRLVNYIGKGVSYIRHCPLPVDLTSSRIASVTFRGQSSFAT